MERDGCSWRGIAWTSGTGSSVEGPWSCTAAGNGSALLPKANQCGGVDLATETVTKSTADIPGGLTQRWNDQPRLFQAVVHAHSVAEVILGEGKEEGN